MPRPLTIQQIIREMAWLAPELLNDEEYMNAWCQKYFGVNFDQELKAKDDNGVEA